MPNVLLADWLQGLVPIIVVLFWILRAFLEAKGNAKPAEEVIELDEPIELEGVEARFGDNAPAGRPANADPMASEVDDFLQRLEQSGGADPRNASQRPPSRAEQIDRQRAEARERRAEQRRQAAEERRQAAERRREQQQAQQARQAASQGESVDEHVRSHIGHLKESQLAENAAHMGEKLSQTDERVAARLEAKFDQNKLGKLASRSNERREAAAREAAKDESPTAAESIAAMLANPEGVRNAVLLNEIMRPPSDRW